MAKGKSIANLHQITTIAIYVLLLAVLSTYFLPIVGVNLPAFGKKTLSVRDIVKVLPKSVSQRSEAHQPLTVQFDFLDLVKEVAPRNPDTKVIVKLSPEFISGALVPVALALTYLLALLSFFIAPLRKDQAFLFTSVLSLVCALYAFLGTSLLGQAARRAFADSLAKVEEAPFAMIAKKFVQEVTIQPEKGFLLLVLFTVLVLGVGLYRRFRTAG